jgi:hypothetical protein
MTDGGDLAMSETERKQLEQRRESAMVVLCQLSAQLGHLVTVRIVEQTMTVIVKNYHGRGRSLRLVTGKGKRHAR